MKTIRFALIALSIASLSFPAFGENVKIGSSYSVRAIYRLTSADITAYLEANEHIVSTEPETRDGLVWTCITRKSDGHTYYTTVFTDGDNIITYEDTQVD